MIKFFKKKKELTLEERVELFGDILKTSVKSISEADYVRQANIRGMDNFGEIDQEFLDAIKEAYDSSEVSGQVVIYSGRGERGGIKFTW